MKQLDRISGYAHVAARYGLEEAIFLDSIMYWYTVTAYCPCEKCCGQWADGLTATGVPAGPGIVAVDPNIIPLGSTVIIDGQRYLAADTGVTGLHVDVCSATHQEADELGLRTADVWIETGGEHV